MATHKKYKNETHPCTGKQDKRNVKMCVCKDVISHCPVFFPGVVMSLAFNTTVFNGVGLCAAPPETVEQENKCWLFLRHFNTSLLSIQY